MKIDTTATHQATAAQDKNAQAQSTHFADILSKTIKPKTAQTFEVQPAALTRLIKPRSHLQLTSLNPVAVEHKPKPAALEKIGDSRILPFVLSTAR